MSVGKVMGYARVSSAKQHLDRQIDELKKYVPEENIVVDKVSGKNFDRPGYQAPAGRELVLGDKPCFSICGDYELDFVVVDCEGVRTGIEVKAGDNRAGSLEFYKGMVGRALRAMPSMGGHGERFDTSLIYAL